MIIENTKQATKSQSLIQNFIQIAVVRLVTSAECTLGIPPEPKAELIVNLLIDFK
jgi:hypothetical protein